MATGQLGACSLMEVKSCDLPVGGNKGIYRGVLGGMLL